MQEISLFSGISSYKKERVMQVLERLTGQKQNAFKEWNLVYAPSTSPNPDPTFAIRPDLYLRLSTSLINITPVDNTLDKDSTHSTSVDSYNSLMQHSLYDWKISLIDSPDAGTKRPVTSRLHLQSHVLSGNVLAFLEELDYVFHFEYITQGVRYIYGNCILTLFQTLRLSERHVMENLVQVDTSGGWILQASIYVENANDPALINQATDELTRIRKILDGVCHLEPVTDNRLR